MIKNLRDFRKMNNLSKEDMARILGISKSYYEKIEYGERNPSYNFQCKFKKNFPNVDINFLIGV